MNIPLTPIAVLSGEEFDATAANPETVELTGSTIAAKGKGNKYMAHEEDVNSDGLIDLVVQVATANLNASSLQDGWAVLTAQTYDVACIEGQDEIIIVPQEN